MHAQGGAIGFRQARGTGRPATRYVRGPVEQWTTSLTMNQKIAGSSPARIDRVLCDKDLDGLVGVLVRNGDWYVM
jgi:hypothetical protein